MIIDTVNFVFISAFHLVAVVYPLCMQGAQRLRRRFICNVWIAIDEVLS